MMTESLSLWLLVHGRQSEVIHCQVTSLATPRPTATAPEDAMHTLSEELKTLSWKIFRGRYISGQFHVDNELVFLI